MKDVTTDDLTTTMFENLEKKLPAIFARKEVPKLFGGTNASGTLDSFGFNGPPYVLSGRHAIYDKKNLFCLGTSYTFVQKNWKIHHFIT